MVGKGGSLGGADYPFSKGLRTVALVTGDPVTCERPALVGKLIGSVSKPFVSGKVTSPLIKRVFLARQVGWPETVNSDSD